MKLLLFGATEYAQVAHYYFTHDAQRPVTAFVVDDAFVREDSLGGVPVIAWSDARSRFPPEDHEMFVAMGYSGLNRLRCEKATALEEAGYRLAAFLHTRAVAWSGFQLRANTFILELNVLQPFTTVGRDVVMWSGNHLGHHSAIDDGCFVASHAVIAGGVRIGARSFVGINVTVRDHVSVGRQCVLGAGAVVLADLPDESVVSPDATTISRVPSSRLRRL
jgi:sugar O-acyltransferase (sialic acid O-acetyltransferase NeuD family)